MGLKENNESAAKFVHLVSALMGLDRTTAAYAHAIDRYRFYAYGHASLLLP